MSALRRPSETARPPANDTASTRSTLVFMPMADADEERAWDEIMEQRKPGSSRTA